LIARSSPRCIAALPIIVILALLTGAAVSTQLAALIGVDNDLTPAPDISRPVLRAGAADIGARGGGAQQRRHRVGTGGDEPA
jgi:hypothetical protein